MHELYCSSCENLISLPELNENLNYDEVSCPHCDFTIPVNHYDFNYNQKHERFIHEMPKM